MDRIKKIIQKIKKHSLHLILGISILLNLLVILYLWQGRDKQEVVDYNKIYMNKTVIDEPSVAQEVAEIYFQDFLERAGVLEERDNFTTTVMFDKDTFEWAVVYSPVLEFPIEMLSNGPADYAYEVRLRMDQGTVSWEPYVFGKYWD